MPIFEADGEADAAGFHAELAFFFIRQRRVRHRIRTLNQRFDLAEAHGEGNRIRVIGNVIDEFLAARTGAAVRAVFEHEIDHRPR